MAVTLVGNCELTYYCVNRFLRQSPVPWSFTRLPQTAYYRQGYHRREICTEEENVHMYVHDIIFLGHGITFLGQYAFRLVPFRVLGMLTYIAG